MVKGSQQLASSKQLARVWNSFVLDPSGTHVELNHIAPKLCSKCNKNKSCNEFSSRIQDSDYGRILQLDFADLEEDIIELSRCKTVLKELNENEKEYVENQNRIVCNKFKYFVILNILNKIITKVKYLGTSLLPEVVLITYNIGRMFYLHQAPKKTFKNGCS